MKPTTPSPHILILDSHTTNPGDLSWEGLEAMGTLQVFERTPANEIVPRAAAAQILLTNKTVLTAEIIAQLPNLQLVCLMSTGTNAVDLDACAKRGIPVCNVPAYSTASVAELVTAYLLTWARAVETHNTSVRNGDWVQSPDFAYWLTPQRELNGRIFGVIGFGEIGQAVTRIAIGLGMRVRAYSRTTTDKPQLGQVFRPLENVLASADVLSLHCPLTPETTRLIRADTLATMKPDALLINTGRGGLIDEADVASALQKGQLGGAFLDVLSSEPPKADNPLLTAPRCVITPHIGWATREARDRLVTELIANVRAFLEGSPRNVVNQA